MNQLTQIATMNRDPFIYFAMQKLLSLIRYHFFIFVFISISLGYVSKRILWQYMSECSASVFL